MENYSPEVFISEEDIKSRIEELARQITQDYQGGELVVLCVLKGAFMFCSDLIKKIDLPVALEFVAVSSYGHGTTSSGEVTWDMDVTGPIEGKDVVIVEDIVDSGLTLHHLKKRLEQRNAKSIKLAALLHKPGKQKFNAKIDYLGFEIEDKFVIGYGLDYAGRYRELPYIGVLNAGQ
jgi:hypoxanthine phosphoribosyltransferase